MTKRTKEKNYLKRRKEGKEDGKGRRKEEGNDVIV